jgi:hypothetical protein
MHLIWIRHIEASFHTINLLPKSMPMHLKKF